MSASRSGGWVRDYYSRSPYMSSYLVAVIVSEFGCVDSPTATGTKVCLRVWLCWFPHSYRHQGLSQSLAVLIPPQLQAPRFVSEFGCVDSPTATGTKVCLRVWLCWFPHSYRHQGLSQSLAVLIHPQLQAPTFLSEFGCVDSPTATGTKVCLRVWLCWFPHSYRHQGLSQSLIVDSPTATGTKVCLRVWLCWFPHCYRHQGLSQSLAVLIPPQLQAPRFVSEFGCVDPPLLQAPRFVSEFGCVDSPTATGTKVCLRVWLCWFPHSYRHQGLSRSLDVLIPPQLQAPRLVTVFWGKMF